MGYRTPLGSFNQQLITLSAFPQAIVIQTCSHGWVNHSVSFHVQESELLYFQCFSTILFKFSPHAPSDCNEAERHETNRRIEHTIYALLAPLIIRNQNALAILVRNFEVGRAAVGSTVVIHLARTSDRQSLAKGS